MTEWAQTTFLNCVALGAIDSMMAISYSSTQHHGQVKIGYLIDIGW